MTRRLFFFASVLPAAADPIPDVGDFVRTMAEALASSTARPFVALLDPAMPGFAQLERDATALVNQNEVTSSISILRDEGDDQARQVELDWFLEIRTRDYTGTFVRRRQVVRCGLRREKAKKRRWRIASFEPLDFFTPPSGMTR